MSTYGQDIFDMSYDEVASKSGDIIELARMYAKQDEYSDDNRKNLSGEFSLYDCTFDKINCSTDFKPYYTFSYGNCFQFNNDLNETNLKKSKLDQMRFGLNVLIKITNLNKYPTARSSGLRVFIHNQSSHPENADGFFVKGGEETSVSVRKTIIKNKPYPYSECVDLNRYESNFYKIIVNSNKTYKQSNCFKLCMQKLIIDNCGCYYTRYVNLNSKVRACLNLSQLECIYEQERDFIGDEISECKKVCPLECESVKYDLQVTNLIFPSKQMYNLMNKSEYLFEEIEKGTTFDMSSDDYIYLNIFYPYLEYTLLTESPKTQPVDLIASVGGSLGLFIGLSVFNFFEVLEVFYLAFYIVFFKKHFRRY